MFSLCFLYVMLGCRYLAYPLCGSNAAVRFASGNAETFGRVCLDEPGMAMKREILRGVTIGRWVAANERTSAARHTVTASSSSVPRTFPEVASGPNGLICVLVFPLKMVQKMCASKVVAFFGLWCYITRIAATSLLLPAWV